MATPIKRFAKNLQKKGRKGDTILAHINPYEAMMLKRMGGSGSINPATGIPEFVRHDEHYIDPNWVSVPQADWRQIPELMEALEDQRATAAGRPSPMAPRRYRPSPLPSDPFTMLPRETPGRLYDIYPPNTNAFFSNIIPQPHRQHEASSGAAPETGPPRTASELFSGQAGAPFNHFGPAPQSAAPQSAAPPSAAPPSADRREEILRQGREAIGPGIVSIIAPALGLGIPPHVSQALRRSHSSGPRSHSGQNTNVPHVSSPFSSRTQEPPRYEVDTTGWDPEVIIPPEGFSSFDDTQSAVAPRARPRAASPVSSETPTEPRHSPVAPSLPFPTATRPYIPTPEAAAGADRLRDQLSYSPLFSHINPSTNQPWTERERISARSLAFDPAVFPFYNPFAGRPWTGDEMLAGANVLDPATAGAPHRPRVSFAPSPAASQTRGRARLPAVPRRTQPPHFVPTPAAAAAVQAAAEAISRLGSEEMPSSPMSHGRAPLPSLPSHREYVPTPEAAAPATAPRVQRRPANRAHGGFLPANVSELQNLGRHGDTMLAHINPYEAMMLKRMGGRGTINPATGLREYNGFTDFFVNLDKGLMHALGPVGDAIGNGLPHLFGEAGIDDPDFEGTPAAPPPPPRTIQEWANQPHTMSMDEWRNMPPADPNHGQTPLPQYMPQQDQSQGYIPQQESSPYGYATGGSIQQLQNAGRMGDTMLAHITPNQATMLRSMGGSGSINPATGLREYGPLLAIPAVMAGSALGASAGGAMIGGTMATMAGSMIGGALAGGLASQLTGGNFGKGALMGGIGGLGFGAMGPGMGLASKMGMPGVGNFLSGLSPLHAPAAQTGQALLESGPGISASGASTAAQSLLNTGAKASTNSWVQALDFAKKYSQPIGAAAALMGSRQQAPQDAAINAAILEKMKQRNKRKELPPIRGYGDESDSYERGVPHYKKGGFLHGLTGGQADKILDSIPENSYVISADVVADLGDGNSLAGGHKLAERFNHRSSFRRGGMPISRGDIPARVSDGEFIVSPEAVADLGRGDPRIGSKKLDALMKNVRRQKATKAFPPKAKSIDYYLPRR